MKKLAVTLLVCTALALLASCGKKSEKLQEQSNQSAVPQTTLRTDWPQELMLDAMVRGHPNSKKVCQDEGHTNSFFVDYSHKEPNDGFYGGWVMIWSVEFHESTNKTLYILEPNPNRYHRVYPDVSGLKCKER